MSQTGYVHLEGCRIVRETEAALLVAYPDPDEPDSRIVDWFPKSQIADPDTYEVGDEDVTVSVTEWIAEQKDIPT